MTMHTKKKKRSQDEEINQKYSFESAFDVPMYDLLPAHNGFADGYHRSGSRKLCNQLYNIRHFDSTPGVICNFQIKRSNKSREVGMGDYNGSPGWDHNASSIPINQVKR